MRLQWGLHPTDPRRSPTRSPTRLALVLATAAYRTHAAAQRAPLVNTTLTEAELLAAEKAWGDAPVAISTTPDQQGREPRNHARREVHRRRRRIPPPCTRASATPIDRPSPMPSARWRRACSPRNVRSNTRGQLVARAADAFVDDVALAARVLAGRPRDAPHAGRHAAAGPHVAHRVVEQHHRQRTQPLRVTEHRQHLPRRLARDVDLALPAERARLRRRLDERLGEQHRVRGDEPP